MYNRKEEIRKQGKHIYTAEHAEKEKEFFLNYNENMTEEQARERYEGGMYGTDVTNIIEEKRLRRLWEVFVRQERIDYITANNHTSMDDILDIGIDKFIRTNGWMRKSDVKSWRNNVVRIGTCPECRNEFVPLMMQANHGLCLTCRMDFSTKAIKRFVENVIATNKRYHNAEKDALMDFYIMFYSDPNFRSLFKKDTDTAKEYENLEFEKPQWFIEKQEKEIALAQARMLNEIDESKKDE